LRSWLNDVIFAVIIIPVMNLFQEKEIGLQIINIKNVSFGNKKG